MRIKKGLEILNPSNLWDMQMKMAWDQFGKGIWSLETYTELEV